MDNIDITQAFNDKGYDIYLVGGSVRDQCLGLPEKDRDYCTNALPDQTYNILRQFGRPHRVGEKFGTIGLGNIEVTTYRSEVYDGTSRKPEVRFGTSLIDDLDRRDFTINAIAKNEATGEIIDPHGGLLDIQNKIIRCVASPADRFSEDPLRMMRAIRLACRLGFAIHPRTYQSIRAKHKSITIVSWERIQDELSKIITSRDVRLGMEMLRDTGLINYIAPEMVMLFDPRSQNYYHNRNIWGHTLDVASRSRGDLVLRWATLLHDVGKMATRTDIKGEVHYYGHEDVGALLAESILRRLRYPTTTIDRVVRLVKLHMQVNFYNERWTDGTVRRLMGRLGDDIDLAIELARCDQGSHVQGGQINDLERRVTELRNRGDDKLVLPVNGNDLMAHFNRSPGPWIGDAKSLLETLVIDGELGSSDRDGAIRVIEQMLTT